MKYKYDKFPFITVEESKGQAWESYSGIIAEIKQKTAGRKKTVIAIECYHGVYDDEILPEFERGLKPGLTITMRDALLDYEYIEKMLERNITGDRVFGTMSLFKMKDFFDEEKVNEFHVKAENRNEGIVLIYGTGASLLYEADILIYADMTRWEIQQRYRKNRVSNWCAENYDEDPVRKYKRGFFVEWRVIDRHKKSLYDKIDYLLDTNEEGNPKMMTGNAFRRGLLQASSQPFRLVPYFDPGIWGGQWMKEVCGLNPEEKNYAWCFDCVPEENSLCFNVDGIILETPAINLVFYQPKALLGDKVHARFGTEFPIRFDFLDTMDGGNLSLQVHPLTEYIQETFGMHYTQDESYYILDAKEEASVFLGVKEDIDRDSFIADLYNARETGEFNAGNYINQFPAKKHDHFLIPAGTVHCSGTNTMVLEISATPYIFTFKLWDWGRLGLDGKPRPVHIHHGSKNIQYDRDTQWVRENLIDRVEEIARGDGWIEERTGLHEREFIETRRHWFTKKVYHNTNDGVNVLNLVEGEEAVVESPEGRFKPFVVHYAETFIIPASVGSYTISPFGNSIGKKLATIKAFVRC